MPQWGGWLRTAPCMHLPRRSRLLCWVGSVLRLALWSSWPPAHSSTAVLWVARRQQRSPGVVEKELIKPPTGNLQQDLLFVDVIGFNPKAGLTHVFLHLVKLCAFPSFFPASLCGVLVFGCALPSAPPPAPPPATLTHTTYSHTTLWHTTRSHKICSHTHNSLHTQLAHTQLSHTHLSHTHNLPTHNSLTHNLLTYSSLTHTQLSHIQLSHTQLSHIQLSSHTTLFTHDSLDTQLSYTQLSHTELSQAWHLWPRAGSGGASGSRWRRSILCGRCSTWGHRPSFCVAGVALGDIDFHSVWQGWHLWH